MRTKKIRLISDCLLEWR